MVRLSCFAVPYHNRDNGSSSKKIHFLRTVVVIICFIKIVGYGTRNTGARTRTDILLGSSRKRCVDLRALAKNNVHSEDMGRRIKVMAATGAKKAHEHKWNSRRLSNQSGRKKGENTEKPINDNTHSDRKDCSFREEEPIATSSAR